MKTIKITCCYMFMVLFCLTGSVSAQENIPAVVAGEDIVFTEFNYHSVSSSPEPWPYGMGVSSINNEIYIYLSASDDSVWWGVGEIGVKLNFLSGNYPNASVMDWPVRVKMVFFYDITVDWTDNSYAFAMIEPVDFYLNHVNVGMRSGLRSLSNDNESIIIDTTPDGNPLTVRDLFKAGYLIRLLAMCQVETFPPAATDNSSSSGSPGYVNTYARAYAYVEMRNISIEFLEPPVSTATTTIPLDLRTNFIGVPRSGFAPLTVKFTPTVNADVINGLWDFGDGETGTDQVMWHTFYDPGLYSVSLTVMGSDGSEDEIIKPDYIQVENIQVAAADFYADTVEGEPPLTVQFENRSTGDITEWYWEFGDGEGSRDWSPRHTYSSPGTYSVSLRVVDAMAMYDTKQKPDYIHVSENALAASFNAEPYMGVVPLAVQFENRSTGDITEWYWEFGDGEGSGDWSPRHIYMSPGLYPVSLRVSDSTRTETELKEDYIKVGPPVGEHFFSLSGKILGEVKDETVVFLEGEEKRAVYASTDGNYEFNGLKPGTYTVTPFSDKTIFSESSMTVTISSQNITEVNFVAWDRQLSFRDTSAEPGQVPADGTTEVLFIAQLNYLTANESIPEIILNLNSIGGKSRQKMYDDGTNGDETPGDGVYTFRTFILPGTQPGPKGIFVEAVDTAGLRIFTTIDLEVIYTVTDTVIMESSQKKTINNDIAGQTLVILFSLEGGSTRSALKAESESSVFIQVFDPENKPYFDNPVSVTKETTEVEIEGAEAGKWTFEIENRSPESKLYNLSVSSTGTGFVNGMVVNAETGSGIDGATVLSTGGGSSITVEGFYNLIQPAGIFTITASNTNYNPAEQTVTVGAGESREVNMVLSAIKSGNDNNDSNDNNTCMLAQVVSGAGRSEALEVLRLFRDDVLSESPDGRHFIKLYYKYSAEVSRIIFEDASLRQEIQVVLNDIMPDVCRILDGRAGHPDKRRIGVVISCLEKIALKGGRDLKNDILKAIKALKNEGIFSACCYSSPPVSFARTSSGTACTFR